jgi:hypothetical protein
VDLTWRAIEELLAAARRDEKAISSLRKRLSHAASYTERATLNRRIRALEDLLARSTRSTCGA